MDSTLFFVHYAKTDGRRLLVLWAADEALMSHMRETLRSLAETRGVCVSNELHVNLDRLASWQYEVQDAPCGDDGISPLSSVIWGVTCAAENFVRGPGNPCGAEISQ